MADGKQQWLNERLFRPPEPEPEPEPEPASTRPTGDADQGARGEPPSRSWMATLLGLAATRGHPLGRPPAPAPDPLSAPPADV